MDGHVSLIVYQGADIPSLSLKIPIGDVSRFSTKPRKWLHYVAWCIMGFEGYLSRGENGREVDDKDSSEPLGEDEQYFYVVAEEHRNDLSHAVDVNLVDRSTSRVTSKSAHRVGDFRTKVIERDEVDLYEGFSAQMSLAACHILAVSNGQYLQSILDSREPTGETNPLINPPTSSLSGSDGINSVQNGVLLQNNLYPYFETRELVILRTPNHVLGPNDVPRNTSTVDPTETPSPRFTFQWFSQVHPSFVEKDACVRNYNPAQHPPPIILDYVYGAAALQRWKDVGYEEFTTRPGLRRFGPSPPVRHPPRQQCTDEDRQRLRSQAPETFSPGSSMVNNYTLTTDEVDEADETDVADEIMMYFLLRTPRALRLQQRLLEEEREKDQRTRDWVAGRADGL